MSKLRRNVFDEGRLKLNDVARLSASSKETFLMREDLNLTMWLDSQEVRGNLFDDGRLKLNHVAKLSETSEETFLMRED